MTKAKNCKKVLDNTKNSCYYIEVVRIQTHRGSSQLENTIEGLVDLKDFTNGFKGRKASSIASLLFKEDLEVEDYSVNFAGKGFNLLDDLLTYRSYRIQKEDILSTQFELEFLTIGLCNAVSNCFYQAFEDEEAIIINNLFLDSPLTVLHIFEGIKNNNNLSLYKFIL